MKFGNLVIAGLVTGSIYAVFAVCVAVWYRVCNILNLAVGDFAMVGALGVDNLYRVKGLPLPVAIATTSAPTMAKSPTARLRMLHTRYQTATQTANTA